MSSPPVRIVIDISTSARWTGPLVGIIRVERELAVWARSNLPDAAFIFFDPGRQQFRQIADRWLDSILDGSAAIESWSLPNPTGRGVRRTDRIPQWIRPLALWVLQSRRRTIGALERMRLSGGNSWLTLVADRVQRHLMSERHRREMLRADGARRAIVPVDLALGDPIELGPRHLLVNVGWGWSHANIEAIAKLKQDLGFRFAIFCYDIIPLMFPHFYKPHDVESFRAHYHAAFPVADVVVFSAHKIETDARAYCAAHGLRIGETRVVPLGADAAATPGESKLPLPAGLVAGRYALFVSTIEPRKGHELLYRVWLRLLADSVPQQTGFKLVFAGRPGWMTEDLIQALHGDARLGGTLVHLSNVDDDRLGALYAGAAFCLYPSLYEGYGLPVIEAFFHSKVVLASTGGAIPEVVGEFSPCLDPADEELWFGTLKRWILDPAVRVPYEQALRQRFRHPTWEEAAAGFFRELAVVRSGAGASG